MRMHAYMHTCIENIEARMVDRDVEKYNKKMLIAVIIAAMATGCSLKDEFLSKVTGEQSDKSTQITDSEYEDAPETDDLPVTSDAQSETEAVTSTEPATEAEVPALRILNIEPFTGDEITIENTQVDEYKDHIDTKADETDVYYFVPPVNGRYRFQVDDIYVSTVPGIWISDSNGNLVEKGVIHGNGEGITVKGMKKEEKYKIGIYSHDVYSSGESDYSLHIFYQKPLVDISTCTLVNDSIEYKEQCNVYKFTTKYNGTYRFEITNKMADCTLDIYIDDEFGESIDDVHINSNGNGVSVYLKKEKTYKVYVYQDSGTSSYTLNVGYQKPAVDISDYDQLTDSLQFEEQCNAYKFTAVEDCTYIFEVSEIKSGSSVYMAAYNHLNETIDNESSCNNGDSISVKMKAGETYHINVEQSEGLPSYTLTWEKE